MWLGEGPTMDEFEFFFSFYGLLLSFSVALVVAGLTNVLGLRRRLRLSPLPVLLGIFLLQDMATLWVSRGKRVSL
jgi:hypothetical protein